MIALSAVAGCSPEDKHANVNTGSAHIAVVADKSITASLLEQYELAGTSRLLPPCSSNTN